MDGKQARRTGASSPLGQLFDHGFDCICNMAHCAISSAYLMNGSTRWFFLQQCTLQYSFFQAQWEEYYTHVLPHSTGQIGVTEVNYGLGVLTIFMGFVDREALWLQQLKDVLPYAVSSCLPLARQSGIAIRQYGWMDLHGHRSRSSVLLACL